MSDGPKKIIKDITKIDKYCEDMQKIFAEIDESKSN